MLVSEPPIWGSRGHMTIGIMEERNIYTNRIFYPLHGIWRGVLVR